MQKLNKMQRLWGHFKTITQHKLKVTALCFRMGLIRQGLMHDLSKYSWIELKTGVHYYQGNRSPIDAEKEEKGFSYGWLHHKGRNRHHWEYWIDRTFREIHCVKMPLCYLKESVCDRIAACKIYQKENYTDASAYTYFMNGSDRTLMNKESSKKMEEYLLLIKDKGIKEAFAIIKQDKEY